ncbi:MAG: tetratricopeptide repeat protein [Planctomycetota bacterium]
MMSAHSRWRWLVLVASLAVPARGQEEIERGQRAYAQGRYAEAAACFERALAHGDDAQLGLALGACYLELHRYADAARTLHAAVDADERSAPAHRALGQSLAMLGEHDQALLCLRRAQSLEPDAEDALWIARILADQGRPWLAVLELEAALRQHPASRAAWQLLGHVAALAGNADLVAVACRELARLAPLAPDLLVSSAQAEALAHQPGAAVDALEAARLLGPLDARAERLLADLYLELDLPVESARAFERLVAAADPANAEVASAR